MARKARFGLEAKGQSIVRCKSSETAAGNNASCKIRLLLILRIRTYLPQASLCETKEPGAGWRDTKCHHLSGHGDRQWLATAGCGGFAAHVSQSASPLHYGGSGPPRPGPICCPPGNMAVWLCIALATITARVSTYGVPNTLICESLATGHNTSAVGSTHRFPLCLHQTTTGSTTLAGAAGAARIIVMG